MEDPIKDFMKEYNDYYSGDEEKQEVYDSRFQYVLGKGKLAIKKLQKEIASLKRQIKK